MKTVKKDRYLSEIARDTRQLLERESEELKQRMGW